MTLLTAQQVLLTGLTPTFVAAAAGGNEFANSGREVVYVRNGGGAPITVTVNSHAPCNQGFDHDAVVSVPAGVNSIIGPFPKVRFDNAAGRTQVTYSGVTTVTVAIVQVA